jgi:hypothetical protein
MSAAVHPGANLSAVAFAKVEAPTHEVSGSPGSPVGFITFDSLLEATE